MLYTNEGSGSPHKTKSKDMSYSQQLAAAMEKHTKGKSKKGNRHSNEEKIDNSDGNNMFKVKC